MQREDVTNNSSEQKPVSHQNKFASPTRVEARVVDVNTATGVYQIQFEDKKTTEIAVWVGSFMSSMLGINCNMVLPKGTRVVVLRGNEINYIIGTRGVDQSFGFEYNTIGNSESLADYDYGKKKQNLEEEFDGGEKSLLNLLEGELDLSNKHGVGIQLLRNLSKLSAGELAKIECFILDDMVRILDNKFLHSSAFGDYTIYNDGGKLNVEWHGASQEHESLGLEKDTDLRAEFQNKNVINLQDSVEDKYLSTGRWRFSQYIGHLGDIIHTFVTDPIEELGKIADTGNFSSGRWNFHVNKDGSCLMQSVADIVFEKVVRIPIPKRTHRYEDTEGNVLGDDDFDDEDAEKTWVPSDKNNIFENIYKLKDYAKWFSNYYSLAKFHRQKKDFTVPREDQTPLPAKDCFDNDKNNQDNTYSEEIHENYINTYSTIRIFRDGSIVLYDAYGSAVTLAGGNVQISATKHLQLEAAGDITMVAGNNILAKSYKDIEFTASGEKGSIRMRGKKGISQFSDIGPINIQSNASEEDLEDLEDDDGSKSAIKIQAPRASTFLKSLKNLYSLVTAGNYVFKGNSFVGQLSDMTLTRFDGEPYAQLEQSGTVRATTVNARIVAASSLMNKRLEVPIGNGATISSLVIGLDDDSEQLTEYKNIELPNSLELGPIEDEDLNTFIYEKKYLSQKFYETLSQQHLKNLVSGDLLSNDDYTSWNFGTDRLNVIGNDGLLPWPGSESEVLRYDPEVKDLNSPSSFDNTIFTPDNEKMKVETNNYNFQRMDNDE